MDAALAPHRRLSVVLPAFNEEHRLGQALPHLLSSPAIGAETEILVVDDGSSDRTVTVAREHLRHTPRARVLQLPWHAGKGAAVRLGVSSATGDVVVFMDADLATDLGAVPKMLALLEDVDVVVGSRSRPGAVVTGRSQSRTALHRAFRFHARQTTGVTVSDPQCGFKGFRAPVAKLLFHLSKLDSFGIDVEILLLAQRLGLRIAELPVRWHAVDGSKVRTVRDPLAMAVDVTLMRVRHSRHRPASAPERR